MRYVLIFLLGLPLLGSQVFATFFDPVWFLEASLSLGLIISIILIVPVRPNNKYLRVGIAVFSLSTLAAFQLFRFVSFFFLGGSFDQRFWFHFNLNSLLEAGGAYIPVVGGAVFYLVLIGALSWTISANLSSKDQREKTTPNILVAMVLLALALIADPDLRELTAKGWSVVRHDDSKISTERLSWDLLGLHPAALDNRLAGTTPGKNLLMIYMESLESLYLDDSVFPGLTPNLIRIRNRALNFTALHQLPGTGWTVAGMLSSQCGTPLIYETGPGTNDILQGGFLNRAVCLGDVLKAAGYRQVFMGGATTGFAGKGEFLKAHGYDEINGREQLVRKLDDPGYTNDWGLYDDSLFLLAERRFAELASDRRPFNLTLLTVDTHHPGGNASKSCADYEAMNNSMLDAVHCTDHLVGQFLDRLAHYPAWNDTLVVLLSDHLAMRNVARRYYPANYDRKLFLSVLNGDLSGDINAAGSHLDIAPTVLDLLGVGHQQAFLAGRSLLASPPRRVSLDATTKWQEAVRLINSRLLTKTTPSLCGAKTQLSVIDGELRLAENKVALTIAGHTVPAERIGKDLAFLALIGERGEANSTMVINADNIGHVLYQLDDRPFLAVLNAEKLPSFFNLDKPETGVVTLLGTFKGGAEIVGKFTAIGDVKLVLEHCTQKLLSASTEDRKSSVDLPALCESQAATSASLDFQTNTIQLDAIGYEDTWYSGRLVPRDNDTFLLVDLENRAAAPGSNGSPKSMCHSYYGNNELLIPWVSKGLAAGESMRLRRVDATEWLFEAVGSSTN